MSAREELHESMCGSCSGPHVARGECEAVDRAIDAYAHELAEKQRANCHLNPGECGCHTAADLIDPEVSSGD